jgi:hypothetical protein
LHQKKKERLNDDISKILECIGTAAKDCLKRKSSSTKNNKQRAYIDWIQPKKA